jgi:hypothetical protein
VSAPAAFLFTEQRSGEAIAAAAARFTGDRSDRIAARARRSVTSFLPRRPAGDESDCSDLRSTKRHRGGFSFCTLHFASDVVNKIIGRRRRLKLKSYKDF